MSLTLISPPFPKLPSIFHNHHSSNPNYRTSKPITHIKFVCSLSKNRRKRNKKHSDSNLASEFASQVQKINTQLEETEIALIKTKQMLFTDFSKFLNMNPNEVKTNWIKMNPDEKLGLIKGFVSDWGLNFHPLSPKSVKDLIDEFVTIDDVDEVEKDSSNSGFDSVVDLTRLKKLIMGGLSSD